MFGDAKEVLEQYDLLAAVLICLKCPTSKQNDNKGLIDLLSTLLSSEITAKDKKEILQNDFTIFMEKDLEEVQGMCNYSDYVFSSGENIMAELIQHLLSDNRIEDAKLATSDENARKELYDEYGIQHI